jgi:hypothetical protein
LKKLISIALLTIFSFYHVGIYGLFHMHHMKIESLWENKLRDHSRSDIIQKSVHISVPFSHSYANLEDENDFLPTNQRMQWQGKNYRLVSSKWAEDTLHLVLVEDFILDQQSKELSQWVLALTGLEGNSDHSGSSLLKMAQKDYNFPTFQLLFDVHSNLSLDHQGFYSNLYQGLHPEPAILPPNS